MSIPYPSPPPAPQPYFTLLLAKRDTVTLPAFNAWVSKDYPMGCMGERRLARGPGGSLPIVSVAPVTADCVIHLTQIGEPQ